MNVCNWFTCTTSKRSSRVTGGPMAGLLAASSMPNISDSSSVSESVLRCRVAESWRNQTETTPNNTPDITREAVIHQRWQHDVCGARHPIPSRNFRSSVHAVLFHNHKMFAHRPTQSLVKKSLTPNPTNTFGGCPGACLAGKKGSNGPTPYLLCVAGLCWDDVAPISKKCVYTS